VGKKSVFEKNATFWWNRVEKCQRLARRRPQQQFSSALEQLSLLIKFDGGELQAVY